MHVGLANSYNIIQKHNGQISVRSRPGETRFSVRLPVDFHEIGKGSKPGQVTEQLTDEDP